MTAKFRAPLVFTLPEFNFNCRAHRLALAGGGGEWGGPAPPVASHAVLGRGLLPGAPGTEPWGQGGKYRPGRVMMMRLGTVRVKCLLHRRCLARGDTHRAKKIIVKRCRR